MTRLEQLAQAVAPRWLINLASQAKANGRASRASRTFGPLVSQLIDDATGHELLAANDGAVVLHVERGDDAACVLKLSTSDVAQAQIRSEIAALEELTERAGLGSWRDTIAQVVDQGQHDGGLWFTQTCLPGTPGTELAIDADQMVDYAIDALRPVHLATTVSRMADDHLLDEMVSKPIALISEWRPSLHDDLLLVNGECRQRLASLELEISRQHGDYAPANVLFDVAAEKATGIVDWTLALQPLPPELDYVHFALSLLMQRRGIEYGEVVVSLLGDAEFADEASPVRRAIASGPNSLDARTALTLTWLQHIAFGLRKAPHLRTNPIWLVNNIDKVVHALRAPV